MPKTTTLPHFHFQTITPFDRVPFAFDQGHGKGYFAQTSCKIHEPISFGPSSKFGIYHDAQAKPQPVRIRILMRKAM